MFKLLFISILLQLSVKYPIQVTLIVNGKVPTNVIMMGKVPTSLIIIGKVPTSSITMGKVPTHEMLTTKQCNTPRLSRYENVEQNSSHHLCLAAWSDKSE